MSELLPESIANAPMAELLVVKTPVLERVQRDGEKLVKLLFEIAEDGEKDSDRLKAIEKLFQLAGAEREMLVRLLQADRKPGNSRSGDTTEKERALAILDALTAARSVVDEIP